MASFLQYTLPGMPSLYYADETGMQGYKDPFCRRPFPWGREDTQLMEHFRRLGQLRKDCEVLRLGDISFFHASDRRLGFQRQLEGKKVQIFANRSRDEWEVPHNGRILLAHKMHTIAPDWMTLAPMGFCIVEVDD